MRYTNILRVAVRIVAPSMIGASEAAVGLIHKIPKQLEDEVDNQAKKGKACQDAREILQNYNTGGSVKEYIQTHPSSIGTDIHRSREAKCAEFTKGYLRWLIAQAKEEGHFETPKAPPVPDSWKERMPKMPDMPSVGDIGGDIKRGFQISALVLLGVILLIVYMLTGRGGKKGGVTVVT